VELFRQAYGVEGFSWVCNEIDHSERGIGLARVIWIFYLSKFLETIDTIIMLLRKKEEQISFLHVYHHFSVIILWWIGARFVPGGDAYWSAMQNSFVHTVMYSYYLLAALDFNVWWKSYITQLQMAQFFLNIVHTTFALVDPHCGSIPKWMGYGMVMYMASLLILFLDFYRKAYQKRVSERKLKRKLKKKDEEKSKKPRSGPTVTIGNPIGNFSFFGQNQLSPSKQCQTVCGKKNHQKWQKNKKYSNLFSSTQHF